MKAFNSIAVLLFVFSTYSALAGETRITCKEDDRFDSWKMIAVFPEDPWTNISVAELIIGISEVAPRVYNLSFQHVIIESRPSYDRFEFSLPHNAKAAMEFKEGTNVGSGFWKNFAGEVINFPHCIIN